MNKKLVVLAVAGAFASPLAVQAQTANVTLYGRLNMDLEFVKGEQIDGSNPTVNRVSSNSSRFGMRGTESLGGGLNAIFQIESSINGDTNADILWQDDGGQAAVWLMDGMDVLANIGVGGNPGADWHLIA